ncbi:aerotaxis receptor [Escherichia coli]|nr:aerotaxis receptor [Escherichia coli]
MKNRRKNGDPYWVRANAVPMVREGQISGYMSIRTRATDEESAAVEPRDNVLNAGRTSNRIHKGRVVRRAVCFTHLTAHATAKTASAGLL